MTKFYTYKTMSLVGRSKKKFSAFTPTNISNCALWLDAADANTVTGTSNVTNWKDKSGNGRNFTATTGPTYSSNTMTFNGSSQVMQNTAWDNFNTQVHTLIALHQPNLNAAYAGNTRLISIQQTDGAPYVIFPYLFNITPNGYINDGSAGTSASGGKTSLLDNSSTSSYNIITASIGANAQAVYKNGTLQDSQTYSLSSGTVTTGVFIGNQYSEWYSGSVKEIIIYTSTLNTSDVNKVEGYLAWKWGLVGSLPGGHPYKNAPPFV